MHEITFEPLPENCPLEHFYARRDAIATAYQQIKTEYHQATGRWSDKFEVTFIEDVTIDFNYRKRLTGSTFNLKFFMSAGQLCYTFFKRSGHIVSKLMIEKMTRIKLVTHEERLDKKRKQVKYIRGLIHSSAWNNLKEELQHPERLEQYARNYGLSLLDMRQRFHKGVIEDLEAAFKNQTDFSYSKPGTRRDISVSTKMCADGIFRAWYSSEYPGCGNGQYYVLVNPHYATFMEPD